MNISVLNQQVETMYGRLTKLYRSINTSSALELLPAALKELGVASEKMQLMLQEIVRQNEQLTTAQKQIEAERQRYQSLFEAVTDALIVTDRAGAIQVANRAAMTLLNVQPQSLVGKPIAHFVASEDQSFLQAKLAQLRQRQRLDFSLRFQQPHKHFLEIALTVCLVHDEVNGSATLRWQLKDVTEQKRAEAALDRTDYDPCDDRPVAYYSKGEILTA